MYTAQAMTCLWQWEASMEPRGPAMQAAGTATDMYIQASGSAPPITNCRQKTPEKVKRQTYRISLQNDDGNLFKLVDLAIEL